MTADVELLPLPSVLLNWPHPTNHAAIRDYARACVAHATAAKDAEIEALRVRADAMAGEAIKHEARAERMTEALRLIAAPIRPDGTWNRDREACRQIARAALRDHDQEVGNE